MYFYRVPVTMILVIFGIIVLFMLMTLLIVKIRKISQKKGPYPNLPMKIEDMFVSLTVMPKLITLSVA